MVVRYGALELERRLGQESNIDVTLVNRDNFVGFTPMLHEVAARDLELTTMVNPNRTALTLAECFATSVTQGAEAPKSLTDGNRLPEERPAAAGLRGPGPSDRVLPAGRFGAGARVCCYPQPRSAAILPKPSGEPAAGC
jgi:hypothetical protein